MVVLVFLLIVEQYPLLQSIQDDLPSDARTFPGSPSAAASGAGETVLVKHGMRVKSPHRGFTGCGKTLSMKGTGFTGCGKTLFCIRARL